LKTIESKLLKTLSELSQPNQWVSQYVNGWLVRNYHSSNYSHLIDIALVEAIKQLNETEKELLRLCYGEKIDKRLLEDKLNLPQLESTEYLLKIQVKLESTLMKEIDKYIHKYIKMWLSKEYKSMVKSVCNDLDITLQPTQPKVEDLDAVLEKPLEKSLQMWQLGQQVGEQNV
jgi:hypothetical protein